MSTTLAQSSLLDEVFAEMANQVNNRLGMNILNLLPIQSDIIRNSLLQTLTGNTLAAYDESAKTTAIVNKTHHQHKNNPNGFGQTLEDLEVGKKKR